ncbi:putative cyanidin-3-O-glucoside 2-O-glucuronosyltransferase-like [Capsicum annuum]|nr:putative cyanidin-3-O-glucoside 2-O-glucuronosyltransferase-like [Capsicum annuum]
MQNIAANQTVIWLFSKNFYVQAINYDYQTMHLVDPTLQKQDLCSLIIPLRFTHQTVTSQLAVYYDSEPIFRLKCPFAVKNDSTLVEISGGELSRYTYLKIGEMKASEVSDGCRVEFIGLTSWPNIKDHESNISLSDFHHAVLYGFDLNYYIRL